MSAFPGLGRREQPTERAIIEVVHEDGTCDCRVPGRPYPYTRLAACSGRWRPHVGQTVEVAFIDYHRTGRRWMPFILGPSSAYMGSGVAQAGRVSRGLSWHNGAWRTPNYTGSLYSLDTGYRPWTLDAGWSIPGPWDAIIGYTVDQGYILTVRGRDARCYRAYNGALAWTHELPAEGAKPVYNPARREVVWLRQDGDTSHVDVILDASTGSAVGGSFSWDGIYGVIVYNDLIYDFGHTEDRDPSVFIRDGINGYRFLRNQTIDTSSGLSGGTSSYYVPGLVTADGIAPYYVLGSKMVAESEHNHLYDGYQYWYAIGILDLSTGSSSITETVLGPPPREYGIFGHYRSYYISAHSNKMSPDGISYGAAIGYFTFSPPDGDPYPSEEILLAAWDTSGARLATHGSLGWDTVPYTDCYRIDYPLSSRRASATGLMGEGNPQICVVKDLSTKLWMKTGTSGQPVFSPYGGESADGEDPWILVRIDGSYIDGSYIFMNPNTGSVLGAWAGRIPVMVSAGVIYDDGGPDGSLRRWIA